MIYDLNNTIEDFFLVRTMISDLELHMIANRIIADIHFGIRQFLRLSVTICKSPLLCFRIYPNKALISDRISIAISREIIYSDNFSKVICFPNRCVSHNLQISFGVHFDPAILRSGPNRRGIAPQFISSEAVNLFKKIIYISTKVRKKMRNKHFRQTCMAEDNIIYPMDIGDISCRDKLFKL